MKQNKKDILLKDLCGRLPYGVKVKYVDEPNLTYTLLGIAKDSVMVMSDDKHTMFLNVERVKPYLFPLSSMTEEQYTYCESLMEEIEVPSWGVISVPTHEYYDYLDENYLDYRGIIPIGLADDATNLNVY